ncbi:hypothetical protein PV327_004091 [Microctonus hyperodae]|uniref:Uncharacterized protein n=1 Tax=Microctonus hyperodae TaxID=165561 RepID=A0AA39KM50_MICHY|nr:hypothetical protein PV327_004091 [Microctonus hyperodae]
MLVWTKNRKKARVSNVQRENKCASCIEKWHKRTSSSSLPPGRTSADHESSNMRNEIKEIQAKQGNNKKQASVKPISAADQRTLYSAIAMAQELTARSMTDLEYSTELPPAPTSPLRRRKFSFKLSHQNSPKVDRRYFSEEAAGIPDIQGLIITRLNIVGDKRKKSTYANTRNENPEISK